MAANNYAQSQKELTTDSLITALFDLMNHKQFSEISISELTKRAGVSRQAFYRNFTDKDELLRRYYAPKFDELLTELRTLNRSSQLEMATVLVQFFGEHVEDVELAVKHDFVKLTFELFRERLAAFYEEYTTWSDYHGTKAYYWNNFMASGLFYVLSDWVWRGKKESIEEMSKLILEMHQ